jgi:hypothetical protein
MIALRHLIGRLAATLALLLPHAIANATVLIDDFADANSTSFINAGLFESTAVQAGSMVGGARLEGLLCYFACDYNPPYRASLTISGGTMAVAPPLAGLATTRVLWGNTSPNSTVFPFASLGLNLSGESAFRLDFGAISAPLLVQFVVVSAGGQSDYRPVLNNPGLVLQAGAARSVLLPFSSFVGAATFSNIAGLAVVLGGNNGYGTEAALASFSLDAVSAVSAVPEPGQAVLLLLGMLGLFAVSCVGHVRARYCSLPRAREFGAVCPG